MGCKKLLAVSHSQLLKKNNMVSRTCLTSNATPAQENGSPQFLGLNHTAILDDFACYYHCMVVSWLEIRPYR